MISILSVSAGSEGIKYDNMWVDKSSPKDGRDADAMQAARRVIVVGNSDKNCQKMEISIFGA